MTAVDDVAVLREADASISTRPNPPSDALTLARKETDAVASKAATAAADTRRFQLQLAEARGALAAEKARADALNAEFRAFTARIPSYTSLKAQVAAEHAQRIAAEAAAADLRAQLQQVRAELAHAVAVGSLPADAISRASAQARFLREVPASSAPGALDDRGLWRAIEPPSFCAEVA